MMLEIRSQDHGANSELISGPCFRLMLSNVHGCELKRQN